MAVSLLGEFALLFQMACVVFLFGYLFAKSRLFEQVLEHRATIAVQAFLAIVFGLLSIYGMSSGISFYTANVNIRDFGPLAGGLACGPFVGLGAGIIGFLYRLSIGGTNVYAVAIGPLAAGIIGGLVWKSRNRGLVTVKTAIIITFVTESAISAFAIAIRILGGESFEKWMTVTINVALPMICMTTIAIGVFCLILQNQIRDRQVQHEKAQLELEVESKRNLSTIINTIAFPVYVLGRDHRLVLVNDSFCRFVGRQREDILGKTHRDLYNASDAEMHWLRVEAAFLNHAPREEEVSITRPSDNSPCTIISTSTMYIDASGQEFMVGVIEEITERRHMQDALEKSEEWYRILFEHTGAATIIYNENTIIDQANSEFENVTGYSRTEVEGKVSWTELILPEDLERVVGYYNNRYLDPARAPRTYTVRIKDKRGSIKTLHAVVAGLPGTSKMIASYVDISEQKRTEEVLTQVNRKLNLLASITRHDIINQILILKGFLTLLKKKTTDPALVDYVERSDRAIRNIERQIVFTRDYQDMGVKVPVWQNVKSCIIQAKGALAMGTVTVDPGQNNLEVYADPLLEKVFYNLIDNSLRYGGEKITTIRIRSEESEHGLMITYEDNGAGISEDEKSHLFERGFGKHTGFGLFLSREILSITGITIREDGELGKGARFAILVPKGIYRFSEPASG